jgi:hypothetical protein
MGEIFSNQGEIFASGGQGALFEKTAPWTVKHLQKLFIKDFFLTSEIMNEIAVTG